MNNSSLLLIYGIAAVLWPLYYILSGFLSGRRHLCTALNAFIAGYLPFVGLSSIAFARELGGVQKPLATYTLTHILSMIGAVVLFTITMLIIYNRARTPVRIDRFLATQPQRTRWQPLVITLIALGVAFTCLLPRFGVSIPIFSELMIRCLSASIIFASLFAFSSWWMDRSNMISLGLFASVFVMCVVLAVVNGGGRRALLGVVLALGVYAYWKNAQQLRRANIVITGTVFTLVALVFISGYNQVRFRKTQTRGASFLSDPISKLQSMPKLIFNQDFTDEKLISDLGQNATNCSLYSISLSYKMSSPNRRIGLSYPSLFHNVLFVVSNPVPRTLWPGKPLSLGYMLPQQRFPGTKVNWGPGLAGHFYHEGGLIMALFYGAMIGFSLKVLDEYIAKDPSNLFAIGFFASCVPQLIVLPRGDMAIGILNVVFAFVVLVVVRQVSFWLYGRAARQNPVLMTPANLRS